MELSSKAHWIENKLINWMVFLVWYGNLRNGKMVFKWMQMNVWLWYCNVNECMILQTMEWINDITIKGEWMYGIAS